MNGDRSVRRKRYAQKDWQPEDLKKKQCDFGRERRAHIALAQQQPSMRTVLALVQSASRRKLEVHSARIILLHCGLKVKFGQRNFSRAPVAEIVERGSDDGIVSNLKLVTIFKHQ